MTTKSPALPKNIAALVKRESELQSSVERWSTAAFRIERDRLSDRVHSGNASDEEIALHADFRDGGKINADYTAMEVSSNAALDAYRRSNWQEFREYLRDRLAIRHQREADIVVELAQVCAKYGIEVAHQDPEAATTLQLAEIVTREDVGFIRFGAAAEVY